MSEPTGRPLTDADRLQLQRDLEEHGAVGQNAVACRCGRTIEHFPNGPMFRDCLFWVGHCDWCEHRAEEDQPLT